MKRKLFAGAIFGLSLLALSAPRDAAAQRWNGRLYGGWSNANFTSGSKMLGSEDRNGFIAGAAVEYVRQTDNQLGFELGLAYVQKGATGKIEPNEMDPEQPPIQSTFDGEAKLDYLETSFLFNIHLPMGDKAEFKLGIGPALGYLLSAKAEGTLDNEPVETDLEKYLSNVDFGVVLSGGFAYALEKVTLRVDVRGTLGGTSISDTALENDLKTRTVGVVFGIEIPLAQ
jgi:opacity protein-like surface antigen